MWVSGALPSCLCPNEAGHPKDAFASHPDLLAVIAFA
jgi:hypothetical protein